MGGTNESVLEAEKGKSQGEVLSADVVESLGLSKKKKKKAKVEGLHQTQNIRQHLSGSEVHFHADDENLKTAIPAGDWWAAVRKLNKGESFSWLDPDNKTIATFTPFFKGKVLDVVVKIESLKVGTRLKQLLSLAK